VQVRVLGTVAVTDDDGHDAARLERKARELLTVLALRAPATVGLDEMTDLLWDDPPPSAVKTIRSHISRLRTALESADVDGTIERSGVGYRLTLADGSSDLDTILEHRTRARTLLADGRADDAASVLANARRIWRGDPPAAIATIAGRDSMVRFQPSVARS
jgi:DNA-binding SARP family transcriptional activator